ncbi:MAG: mandelate racemase/muconate lactonizing enzyme family protein [Candidatus Latescibacteria bacterium]|nr:mandelate racemase/muconate lactonizing enzyme family protein [Candidatus Latescibacterota bacterium]
MKITRVQPYYLQYPLDEPFANSHAWSKYRIAHLVEISTDAGVTGWGEGSGRLDQTAMETALVGRNPFDIELIWDHLYRGGRGDIAAFSAIDIALWDIVGRALDLPIYQLLGGAHSLEIPAYASGLFRKDRVDMPAALAEEAKGYVDQGFKAVKMKIGFSAHHDVPQVEAVRRAIGDDILLAVDANCAYDVATAMDVGRRLVPFDLYWYEEPITPDDVDGYLAIGQALPVAIAGGEGLEGRWAFRHLLQRRALDIVQPDLCIGGGFTECRKVAAMASANHIRILPHMWGSSIRLAATLHWQATLPQQTQALEPEPSLLEFDMTENKLRTELARPPIVAIDGVVKVPEGPGLGIEIDREVLERYAV